MQFAVAEALLGDRSHQPVFRAELKKRAEVTASRLNAMPGMTCVAPIAGFYVMPQLTLPAGRTDEDYVLGLLRATGVLCVYGSGFGMPKDGGFFRIVFLARPDELAEIYGLMADFTKRFLANG
jgi:alanine-synthesizing transaminase